MHLDHSSRGSFDDFVPDLAAALSAAGGDAVLRSVVDGTGAGIVVLDLKLCLTFANAAFARMLGTRSGDRLVGRPVGELLGGKGSGGAEGSAPDLPRRVLRDGRPRAATIAAPGGTESWRVMYHRLEIDGRTEGVVGVAVPTGIAPAAPDGELAQARDRLALLDAATQRVGTTLDPDLTCQQLAEFAVPQLADAALVELVPTGFTQRGRLASEGIRLRRVALVTSAPALADVLTPLEPGRETGYGPRSAVVRCLATGECVEQELSAGSEGLAAHAAAAGFDSVLAVPLQVRGRLVGALTLGRPGGRPAFTEHDLTVATDLARRSAVAVDNAVRYSRSQTTAMQLQRALLSEPGSPHVSVELASRHAPSGTSTVVGGDWSEAVRLAYGRTLLVIGDVMGHGVEAAVDMSGYRSLIRYLAGSDLPPHRILRQVDTMITEADSGRPATCLLALLDPARGRITFASAGHLPPALFSADGPGELVDLPVGPPLGTGFGGYESSSVPFRPGQVLLMYTDGLVERRGEDIDDSLGRLAALSPPVAGSLETLLDTLMARLVTEEPEDDIAVLAARIHPRQPQL